jgi:hypothetical protein
VKSIIPFILISSTLFAYSQKPKKPMVVSGAAFYVNIYGKHVISACKVGYKLQFDMLGNPNGSKTQWAAHCYSLKHPIPAPCPPDVHCIVNPDGSTCIQDEINDATISIDARSNLMLDISMAQAKMVCPLHPEDEVWLFHSGSWDRFPCAKLGEVFALDSENPIDILISLAGSSPKDKP